MSGGFLLDTSFLSELSPGRKALPGALNAWVLDNFGHFHLCTISVVEIAAGIAKLRRMEQAARADAYEGWLNQTLILLGSRVLDLGVANAREAGAIGDHAVSKGRYPGFADVAIAATARVHELTIVTRNLKHFVPLDVPCLDPFELE